MIDDGKITILTVDTAAVIFDLDGTLYTLRGLGFHITIGLLGSVRPLRNLFSVRDEMRGTDFGSLETFKRVFAEKLGSRCGMTPEGALAWYDDRFMPRFIRVLKSHGRVREGFLPLLENLRSRGLRIGVVSDFGRVQERLSALGISPAFFDEVAGAEDFGVMKPSAKPFLSLLNCWGVAPERAVLVGDRADHDLGSAQLLGSRFWGIENPKNRGDGFFPWLEVKRLLEGPTQVK